LLHSLSNDCFSNSINGSPNRSSVSLNNTLPALPGFTNDFSSSTLAIPSQYPKSMHYPNQSRQQGQEVYNWLATSRQLSLYFASQGVIAYHRIVYIEHDCRIRGRVRSRKGDKRARCTTSSTSHRNLSAREIELCATCAAGLVQRNVFDPEKIVTRRS
jgi:hypothetical protein